MSDSGRLKAELSFRIRTILPEEWKNFSGLWMAFNAIYGGEPDDRERARVMSCIRCTLDEPSALIILHSVNESINKILAIPPGNLLLNRFDPKFRRASQRSAILYKNTNETAVSRLAAVGAILYQIRCNLIHGSKDPQVERDRMLVLESVNVLNHLLPALENALVM